jgi:hypothetical protein
VPILITRTVNIEYQQTIRRAPIWLSVARASRLFFMKLTDGSETGNMPRTFEYLFTPST